VEFLRSYLGEFAHGTLILSATCASFLVIEGLFPRPGVAVTTASRLKALVFWSVNGAIGILIADAIAAAWLPLGIKPLLPSLAPPALPAPVSVAIGVLAAAYIGDFFYYWCHRFQHRFLWRFHAVHHSVREMSGVTAYHHVTEGLFEFVLYSVPLTLLTHGADAVPYLGALLAWQGNYEHSPTRLNFGPLGRYFVDNRFHRIHHSVDPRHFDRNFGIFTTLWDSVFGTAYFPSAEEWPETGVAEMPEPATIRDFLMAPLRWRAPAPATAVAREALPSKA
jgi:sterol desaturase/sphingolipid hydroxylase (fatty acid hydroxylase superfamily)